MNDKFVESAFWDDRYRQNEFAYGSSPNDFLREHSVHFSKKGTAVLTLGEGEGRNAVFLAQMGCIVRGVDFSPAGREKALQLAKRRRVEIDYMVADLTEYEMGTNAWDGVVSIFCHLSDKDRPALFSSISRALKPGGIFLLESYNRQQLDFGTGGPRDGSFLLSLDELENAFPSFEILVGQEIERAVVEGTHHQGRSSVTQFIARNPI